jgi:hypothetical protein
MDKKNNAQMLDPMRFKISQQNAVVPGGPQNNNPMNVTGIGQQSASPNGISQHPYGDTGNMYPQMGADVLNPMQIGPSGLQQNFPMGQRNNGMPFGMQQQPDTSGVSPATDGMEAGRQAQAAQQRGLFAGPMGMMGQPVVQGNMPENPAFSGPPMMQGMPSAEQAAGKGMNTRTGKRGK